MADPLILSETHVAASLRASTEKPALRVSALQHKVAIATVQRSQGMVADEQKKGVMLFKLREAREAQSVFPDAKTGQPSKLHVMTSLSVIVLHRLASRSLKPDRRLSLIIAIRTAYLDVACIRAADKRTAKLRHFWIRIARIRQYMRFLRFILLGDRLD